MHQSKVKLFSLELYITTYSSSMEGNEFSNSRRLRYLLESKRSLVSELKIVDVNTEIMMALSSSENKLVTGIRETLVQDYGLVRNDFGGQVVLPQAFLISQDGAKTCRNYLGDYQALQYMEDCGILEQVFKGEICTHYRIHKGRIFFRHVNSRCCECQDSSYNSIQVMSNFLNPYVTQSHNLCLFFERNNLPFTLSLPPFEDSHKVFIHGVELSLEKLFSYVKKDVLLSVINGIRCTLCLAKLPKSPSKVFFCNKCKVQSVSKSERVPAFKSYSSSKSRCNFYSENMQASKPMPVMSKSSLVSAKKAKVSTTASLSAQMQLRQSLQLPKFKETMQKEDSLAKEFDRQLEL